MLQLCGSARIGDPVEGLEQGEAQLMDKLRSVLGAGQDDPNIPNVAATFMELSKLAQWESVGKPKHHKEKEAEHEEQKPRGGGEGSEIKARLGLSYTINLNLPATTEMD